MPNVSLRTIVFSVWSLLAAAVLFSPPRVALADTDVAALKQQVEALTRTVGDLAGRVQALEQKLDNVAQDRQPATHAVASPNPPPAAGETGTASMPAPVQSVAPGQLVPPAPPQSTAHGNVAVGAEAARAVANYKPTPQESWAQLKDGMSQSQVTALLGVPTKTFKVSGQTVWYYYYRDVGAGSVFFYDDGRVASRQRPPFSGWHWW